VSNHRNGVIVGITGSLRGLPTAALAKAGAARHFLACVSKSDLRVDFRHRVAAGLEGHDFAEFALVPQGDSTNVTWTMDGPSPYIGKLIGVFVNVDAMIGTAFETGLANLKTIAEK
jgi:hypothetical protein